MELFNYCFVIYVTTLYCQDTLYQELQCVLPTKYSSRWVFVRFPSVFCSFNNSKSVKLKFIEFVRLKAFFQVVHFICSMQELDPSFRSISMSIQKTFRSVSVFISHFTVKSVKYGVLNIIFRSNRNIVFPSHSIRIFFFSSNLQNPLKD